VGINNLASTNHFSVYPNPFTDNVNINLKNQTSLLQIIDVTGKIILSKKNIPMGVQNINLNQLKKGIYFIRIVTDNQIKVKRIIKE